jgi:hypothetical protein
MTKKNLVASFLAAVVSVTLLTGAREPVATSFQTKSVTQEAAHSVTKPSTKVASRSNANVSRSTKRTTKTYVVKKTQKSQVKPSNLVRNVRGVQASAWRGKFYNPRWENVRKCIVFRESRGNYSARNKRSTAAGAYQFLISTSNGVAKSMKRRDLVGKRASAWTRAEQDQAFWTLFNNGKGKGHWRLQGHRQCW